MSKKEVELEGKVEISQAVSFIEGLLEGLNSGTICLEKGPESLVLTPGQEVEIEIKGSQKKNKEKISFELSWEIPAKETPEEVVEFRISSKSQEDVENPDDM
jgi:amphi-Trp domain-containing protein